jgi:CRISPR-associated protein Csb2
VLAIEVEYLLGRAYAADFRDDAKPEWPPHPARLFSALVAAHHDADATEEERGVLLWLEQQSPPQILAKEAGQPDSVVTFVPTNYASKSGSTYPEQRGKQPRFFSAQGPASPVVHFVWPEIEVSGQHLETLKQLVSRVGSLGRACSLVRARVMDANKDELCLRPNYLPDDSGQEIMAVASRGRLEELERWYNLGRRPALGVLSRYRRIDQRAESAVREKGTSAR